MVRAKSRLIRFTILTFLLTLLPVFYSDRFEALADSNNSQASLRTFVAPGNAGRGKELFVNKGCVVCHSINGAGGVSGPPLDIDPSVRTIDVFEFAARMWKGAEQMIALQVREVGFPIELNGEELTHLAYFLHDYEAQQTFSNEDIPLIVRELLEAEKKLKQLKY